MTNALLLLATCLLAALGFAAIAVSQKQHRPLVQGAGAQTSPVVLRLVGSLLIAAAAVTAVLRDGLAFGPLLWATMLTVSAALVVAWLSKRPRHPGEPRES